MARDEVSASPVPQEWGRTELAAHKLGDPEAAAVRDFFKVWLTGLASIARPGRHLDL